MTKDMPDTAMPAALSDNPFLEMDTLLDDLRSRQDEMPTLEFCDGFMAAMICCRQPIMPADYLPVLLGTEPGDGSTLALFADSAQFNRFLELWMQRWNQVAEALDTEIEALDEERAYAPEIMDVRGALAALPPESRAEMADTHIPCYAQVWATGFMYAVENWPEEWAVPRDRQAAQALDAALECIVALTEDDTDLPTINGFDEQGEPTVSQQRVDALADALWAVYDLRELWRSIGPRVKSLHRPDQPGRNEPCSCGSGKKYKKCCGSNS